jgi:tetratricopeptide (TPR) repeat protein
LARAASRLPSLERVQLRYLQTRLAGDETNALAAAREMARLSPGTGNHYLQGYHALRTNRPAEAVRVLKSMDPDRGFLRGWFWYRDVLAQSYHLLGKHRSELAVAQEAAAHFPEHLPARQLVIRSLAAQGRVRELLTYLEQTISAPDVTHLARGYVFELTAWELQTHGHEGMVGTLMQRALAAYQPAMELEDSLVARARVVRTLLWLGRPYEALPLISELREQRPESLELAGLEGVVYARLDMRAPALAAARRMRERSERFGLGSAEYWEGAIRASLGDHEYAVEALSRAFQLGMPFGTHHHSDGFLQPLSRYTPFQRLMEPRT